MKLSELLTDPDLTATSAYLALRETLGRECCEEWEPESVRLEIKDRGLEPADENVDAYMAIRACQANPSFLWDANVFENLVLALNKEPVDPGSIQYASPPQIAWALKQLEVLVTGEWELDYEPVAYVVASCVHYGLVCCPPELGFASDELARLTPHADELRDEVKKRAADVANPVDHPYAEDAVGVQLALLGSVSAHVASQEARMRAEFKLSAQDD